MFLVLSIFAFGKLFLALLEGDAGADVGILNQLAEAIHAEGADPRDERTDDHHHDAANDGGCAAEFSVDRRAVSAHDGRTIESNAGEHHGNSGNHGCDDAEPAQNLCERLDFAADVVEHEDSSRFHFCVSIVIIACTGELSMKM